ncbi:MAG: asparagine synthase (glutamine-hydrolyzing) [Pseudolabrys sp.]
MCGIAGIISIDGGRIARINRQLELMNRLIQHRGPDGEGIWVDPNGVAGLAHRRLSIIDLSPGGAQPMIADNGTVISFNGEIYNYIELQESLRGHWTFKSRSDTETMLAAYDRYGEQCLAHLRGMFAFALWDQRKRRLLCARDRFGIKPFYYAIVDGRLYFASEAKALVPFLPAIETDAGALAEYLTFQYTIGEQTLFRGVKQLLPGQLLVVENGRVEVKRYWDVEYNIDFDHTPEYFVRRLQELMRDSVAVHLRSDVPVGSYLSGGIDSSLMALMAAKISPENNQSFHGKFTQYPGYDESQFALVVAQRAGNALHEVDITADDFRNNIEKVIYHLDFPVAGPGSFPQYMVSQLAAQHVKVVLGGQGGDEVFGGYARYLLAYFEQCIKAAVDGNYRNGHYVVTIESIVPNLGLLREYKPLMSQFWSEGLFGELDARYYRLVDRSADMSEEVDWSLLDKGKVFEDFRTIFNNPSNVRKEAYFDKMTHFDFKCLLPALLHVEDRMSMAHGLESRVPLLDHPLIEFAATVPADVKFRDGQMKHLIRTAFEDVLPGQLMQRRDKMGFPVPLKEWFAGELSGLLQDVFRSEAARARQFMNSEKVLENVATMGAFSRKIWGLLSLELWHQMFHDRASEWKGMANGKL